MDAATPPGSEFRAAVALTCRHVTPERIADASFGVLDRIERLAATKADILGLWLPGGRAPTRDVQSRLLRGGLLVSFNADSEPDAGVEALPGPCVGMTDHLDRATVHADDS